MSGSARARSGESRGVALIRGMAASEDGEDGSIRRERFGLELFVPGILETGFELPYTSRQNTADAASPINSPQTASSTVIGILFVRQTWTISRTEKMRMHCSTTCENAGTAVF